MGAADTATADLKAREEAILARMREFKERFSERLKLAINGAYAGHIKFDVYDAWQVDNAHKIKKEPEATSQDLFQQLIRIRDRFCSDAFPPEVDSLPIVLGQNYYDGKYVTVEFYNHKHDIGQVLDTLEVRWLPLLRHRAESDKEIVFLNKANNPNYQPVQSTAEFLAASQILQEMCTEWRKDEYLAKLDGDMRTLGRDQKTEKYRAATGITPEKLLKQALAARERSTAGRFTP